MDILKVGSLMILLSSCHEDPIKKETIKPKCNLPSVFCSNGEMWNGTKCPDKYYVLEKFECDSLIYKHR